MIGRLQLVNRLVNKLPSQQLKAIPQRVAKRNMSHGHQSVEQMEADVAQWTKITWGMCGLTAVVTVYNIIFHSHEHARNDLPFQKIKNKPYPWKECPNCNIFDGDCWKQCRGEDVDDEHH